MATKTRNIAHAVYLWLVPPSPTLQHLPLSFNFTPSPLATPFQSSNFSLPLPPLLFVGRDTISFADGGTCPTLYRLQGGHLLRHTLSPCHLQGNALSYFRGEMGVHYLSCRGWGGSIIFSDHFSLPLVEGAKPHLSATTPQST